MKKQNNNVVGVDISETAINVAQSRFPDIQFKSLDVGEIYVIDELISDAFEGGGGPCFLVRSSFIS